LNFGSNGVILSGGNAQSVAGFTTTGTFTVNKSALTATLAGNLTTGDVALTAGTLAASSNTINVGGNWTGAATFTANTGTVDFSASGTQTLPTTATTFNNLTIDGSGTKTFGSATIVSSALTVLSGTTLSTS